MYYTARQSTVPGHHEDHGLPPKQPTFPSRSGPNQSHLPPEDDRKMPARLYPLLPEDERKMPAKTHHLPPDNKRKMHSRDKATAPGAVAAPPHARDPAAVKEAAARNPTQLKYASANTAYTRSEARYPRNHSEDVKQRYRRAGANDQHAPGAERVAGIATDTPRREVIIDEISLDDNDDVMDVIPLDTSKDTPRDPERGQVSPEQAPTITAQLAPTDDEVIKRVMDDIPVAEIAPSHKKRRILLTVLGILALAGLGAGLYVALKPGETADPPSPPFEADTCLEEIDNPSIIHCVKEEFPIPSLSIQFQDCPTSNESRVFECESCVIGLGKDITDLNNETEVCNGCIICDGTVSFDCTNFYPEEECALQTCSGNCGKDPPPPPSSETKADDCVEIGDDEGTLICLKEDIPFDIFVAAFLDCPPGAENNVFECGTCGLFLGDSIGVLDPDNLQICSGCINCGDSLAYDCTNLFPEERCAAVDLNAQTHGN